MDKPYHILNGDALKEIFPASIEGEIIVFRECLVEGNVTGENLEDFLENRAEFISSNFEGLTKADYFEKTVSEFQKIQQIPNDAAIHLWFEDDLFCQVNFWFIINFLRSIQKENELYLIRPLQHSPYSFGHMNKTELLTAYTNKLVLNDRDTLSRLWDHYQANAIEDLIKTGSQLEGNYPFIPDAIKAHIERIPANGNKGRPMETLMQIIDDLQTTDFAPVFQEFCKREAIYGFGDVQVKRLYDELVQSGDSM